MAQYPSQKLKGQNLRVFITGYCVAYATSCKIDLKSNLEDASTKDSVSGWDENELTGKSWSIDVDALHSVASAGGASGAEQTGETLTDAFLNGGKLQIKFAVTNGEMNRDNAGLSYQYEGQAWISSLGVTAQNKQNCQLNVQFTGDGPLTKVAVNGAQ